MRLLFSSFVCFEKQTIYIFMYLYIAWFIWLILPVSGRNKLRLISPWRYFFFFFLFPLLLTILAAIFFSKLPWNYYFHFFFVLLTEWTEKKQSYYIFVIDNMCFLYFLIYFASFFIISVLFQQVCYYVPAYYITISQKKEIHSRFCSLLFFREK